MYGAHDSIAIDPRQEGSSNLLLGLRKDLMQIGESGLKMPCESFEKSCRAPSVCLDDRHLLAMTKRQSYRHLPKPQAKLKGVRGSMIDGISQNDSLFFTLSGLLNNYLLGKN